MLPTSVGPCSPLTRDGAIRGAIPGWREGWGGVWSLGCLELLCEKG